MFRERDFRGGAMLGAATLEPLTDPDIASALVAPAALIGALAPGEVMEAIRAIETLMVLKKPVTPPQKKLIGIVAEYAQPPEIARKLTAAIRSADEYWRLKASALFEVRPEDRPLRISTPEEGMKPPVATTPGKPAVARASIASGASTSTVLLGAAAVAVAAAVAFGWRP